jgi:hypothetical protein
VTVERAAVGALAFDDETTVGQDLAVRFGRTETLDELVPGIRREADHELLDRLPREAALLRVFFRACIARQHQNEVLRHLEIHVVQRLGAAGVVGLTRGFARHIETEPARELLDGLGKRQLVVFHEEAQRRAVRSTAEAVIELFLRAHPERGRLLVVERTARAVFAPGLLQLHARADELYDVRARGQFVDEALGNAAGHAPDYEGWLSTIAPGAVSPLR